MLLHVPRLLSPEEVCAMHARLTAVTWGDGRITAGHQSVRVKHNLQLPESDPVARELSYIVRAALGRSSLFIAAALPLRIFPPLFNCYRSGDSFGDHVDNALRHDRPATGADEAGRPLRTDLSATLFVSSPEDYAGGELSIEDNFGRRRVKFAAGDMVLYPASSVHRVEPVTRGRRLASFFWIQSLVRDAGQRQTLFDLDTAIQQLERDHAGHPALVSLVGIYHNLLRRWVET
ncbi:MAG TPA: Fe2+-dependent dioxygenase [Steroidobacteraceae bacterium]|jgi:PKHD-type hydroxylase